MNDDELKKIVEQKQKEVWNLFGFTGEPTMICLKCDRPCNWDKEKDIILCTRCGMDWTLKTMKEECEKILGEKID